MNKKELKKQYLQNLPAMGIFKVENSVSKKLFVDFGLNVKGKINGCKFQLDNNSHPNKGLQEDYNTFGGNNFIFEVIDILEPKDNESKNYVEELKILEEMWIEKLKSYNEFGYNKRKC
ncbi:MAG: GIY-YIG nuclease family protein [Ignavibacteriales bacterium]|nr:GIY-YIG nuclease family protein [Ignavibacteriales bacterium]